MRTFAIAAVACVAGCLLAAGPRAELYQWTDEHGQVHVTDDGAKVPAGKPVTLEPTRARSGAMTKDDVGKPQAAASLTTGMPTRAATTRTLPVGKAQPRNSPGRVHVLHFARAGNEISLDASLEDRVPCNFKADTGASLNTLPHWAAEELGVEIDEDTPTISVVGVSGQSMRVPVVTIASIRIGTLYVENIEFAVLDTMSSGLLGMPFFNRFQVAIDPAEGELRLTEIDLDSVDGVYGGVGQDTWRQRFRQLHQQLAAIQKARDSVPPELETASQGYFERLDREEQKVQGQLDELEDRAQAAGVPASWR
jgi:clan AA aspartic protease (TIGR02281 family)